MRIALLAAGSSIHTVRWANGLSAAGHDVYVISQHRNIDPLDSAVKVHLFPFRGALGYFTMVPAVRKLLREIQPELVNAHYASGYATTARLVGCRPWVLSVWGSDIYDFPYKSPLHKGLVNKNLRAADQVASTSHCMAEQIRSFAPGLKDIAITPFGVDLSLYAGIQPEKPGNKAKLVIGTVKTMKPKYGIDTLIEAYALLVQRFQSKPDLKAPGLELRLVGGGDQTAELQTLAERLGVADSVRFIGRVPHSQVPSELAMMDIYVALSRSESFGVAILEAGAAGRPVVVSDAGGLPEVTVDSETGFVVPRDDPQAAAYALEKLALNASLRQRMGVMAQRHVAENYSWEACVRTMLAVYDKTIQEFRKGK